MILVDTSVWIDHLHAVEPDLVASLGCFPVLTHEEMLTLVDRQRLWGRGLSAVDAHLLGAVLLAGGAQLWTRDKRLRAAAGVAGVDLFGRGTRAG